MPNWSLLEKPTTGKLNWGDLETAKPATTGKPDWSLLSKVPKAKVLGTTAQIIKPAFTGKEPKDVLGKWYTPARAYSGLIEEPVYGSLQMIPQMLKLIADPASSGFRYPEKPAVVKPLFDWMQKHVVSGLDKAIDYLDPYSGKLSYVTPKVAETRAARSLLAKQHSYKEGVAYDVAEAVTDFGMLWMTMGGLKSLPGVKSLLKPTGTAARLEDIAKTMVSTGKLHKLPLQAKKVAMATQLGQHAAVLGAHGFLTTPGDMVTRAKSSFMRMLYNITPAVVGWSGVSQYGSKFLAPVLPRVLDTLLNSAIGWKDYAEKYKAAGGANPEFWAMAIPQFAVDFGMALWTSGLPDHQKLNYRKAEWGKRAKGAGISFEKYNQAQDKIERVMFQAERDWEKDRTRVPVETARMIDTTALKLQDARIDANLKRSGETRRKAKEAFPTIRLKGGGAGTEIDLNKMDPQRRQELLVAIEAAEDRGQDFKSAVQSYVSESQNQIRWHKGDATDRTMSCYYTNLEKELSYDQIAIEMFKDKLTPDDMNFVSLSKTNTPEVMKSTLERAIRQQQVKVVNDVPEVKPVMDEVAKVADEQVAKIAKPIEGKAKAVEVFKPKVVSEVKPTVPKPSEVKPSVSRNEPMSKWDWNTYRAYRWADTRNIPVEKTDRYLRKVLDTKRLYFGAGVDKNRDKIYVNEKTVDRLFQLYNQGKRWYHGKGIILPPGLTRQQFQRFAIEHEKVHLATGLDGGRIDENMANAIALERIGRDDLARKLFQELTPKEQVGEAIPKYEEGIDAYDKTGFDMTGRFASRSQTLTREQSAEIMKDQITIEREAREQDVAPLKYQDPVKEPPSEQITLDKLNNVIGEFLSTRPHLPRDVDLKTGTYRALDVMNDADLMVLRDTLRQNGFKGYNRIIKGKPLFSPQELYQSKETNESMFSEDVRIKANASYIIKEINNIKSLIDTIKDPTEKAKAQAWLVEKEAELQQMVASTPDIDQFVQDRKRIVAAGEKNNRRMVAEGEVDIIDPLGGGPIAEKDAPYVGRDGKDGVRFGMGMKMLVKAINFFDVMPGFDKFISSKSFTKWFDMQTDQAISESSKTYQTVIGKTVEEKRARTLQGYLMTKTSHMMNSMIWEGIKNDPIYSKTTWGKQKELITTKADALNFADQEIYVNKDGGATEYSKSDIGNGGPWDSAEQMNANIKHYQRLASALGRTVTQSELTALQQGRQPLMFFNLLSDHDKNSLIWYKRNVQSPWLERMLQAGLFKHGDILDSVMRGYTRAVWRPKGWQAEMRSDYKNVLRPADYPEKEYKTQAEFMEAGERGGWIPISDITVSAADYVGNSFRLVRTQGFIDFLKMPEVRNPMHSEYPGVVHIGDSYRGIKMTHDLAQKLGYVAMPEAWGLDKFTRGGFKEPLVHFSLAKALRYAYSPNRVQALDGVKWLQGIAKRVIMWSPRLYVLQMASSPWLWMGVKNAWKYGVRPIIIPGEMEIRGLMHGVKTAQGKEGVFTQLQGEDFDPVLVEKFLQYGIKLGHRDMMNILWDSTLAEKDPVRRNGLENALEFVRTKGGIDTYAMDHYVAKNVYMLSKSLTELMMNKHPGMSLDDAVKRVAIMVGDFTGLLDGSIYGAERDALQFLWFARDFTVSFARQVTGAMGLHMEYKTEGPLRFLNPFLHAEVSSADLKSMQGFYIRQLLQTIMAKVLLVNLFQKTLTGTWAWANEAKKKLMIKTPFTDESGKTTYLDPLVFREASQLVDILPRIGPLRDWSRGPQNLFKSKLGIIVRGVSDFLSNKDYSGQNITSNSEAVSFIDRFKDQAGYQMYGMLPQPVRPTEREKGKLIAGQFTGVGIKKGKPLQEGWTWQEARKLQDTIDRAGYTEDKVRQEIRKYPNVDAFLQSDMGKQLVRKGMVSIQRLRGMLLRERFPQTSAVKQSKRVLLREGWSR